MGLKCWFKRRKGCCFSLDKPRNTICFYARDLTADEDTWYSPGFCPDMGKMWRRSRENASELTDGEANPYGGQCIIVPFG
jgi:hypothetical protein